MRVPWFTFGLVLSIPALSASDAAVRRQVAGEIFERLLPVIGRSERPQALVVRGETERLRSGTPTQRVAWFDPATNAIHLDDRAIQTCESLGRAKEDGCLAFLIGHELAHFAEHHGWGGDFARRLSSVSVAGKIAANNATVGESLKQEAQADDLGGIYGYLAGIDSLGAASETLTAIYRDFQIPADLRGYPILNERERIAQESKQRLARLVPLFETGDLLLAIGQFGPAALIFEQIARVFPSREVWNNAGVARALAAAALAPDFAARRLFAYPWLIDTDSRLHDLPGTRSRGRAANAAEERKMLLGKARDDLTESARRDPQYAAALVNLALVEDLLGRYAAAVQAASDALSLAYAAGALERTSALVARAIANFHDERPERARSDLEQADPADAQVSSWLGALDRREPELPWTPPPKIGPPERVAGLLPSQLSAADNQFQVLDPDLLVATHRTATYVGYIVKGKLATVKALAPLGAHTEGGRLARGLTAKEVRDRLGDPARVVQTVQGQWWTYPGTGVVVVVRATVTNWIAYSIGD